MMKAEAQLQILQKLKGWVDNINEGYILTIQCILVQNLKIKYDCAIKLDSQDMIEKCLKR